MSKYHCANLLSIPQCIFSFTPKTLTCLFGAIITGKQVTGKQAIKEDARNTQVGSIVQSVVKRMEIIMAQAGKKQSGEYLATGPM